MVAVLPAPTAWASSARPSVRIRATAARWWWRGGEGAGEAGEGQVVAVVVRQDGGGEQLVVAASEAAGSFGFLPHPGREPGGERLLLVSSGEGLGVVADPFTVVGGVGHGVEPLVERRVEQRDRIGAAGAPFRGQGDAAPAAVA